MSENIDLKAYKPICFDIIPLKQTLEITKSFKTTLRGFFYDKSKL